MNNFCCANLRFFIVYFLGFLLCRFKIFCCAKNWNRYPPRPAFRRQAGRPSRKLYNVPGLPTEGSLQNGVEYRKAICKKCIMPIKTSHGQLSPVRRGGYRLYFLSLAKPACRQTYLSAPADRTQSRNWGNSPLTR